MKTPYRYAFLAVIIFLLFSSCTRLEKIFHPGELPEHLESVNVENIPIVYSDEGHGEPLIILSTYPLEIESWMELTRSLIAHFRVIVVEPPWLTEPIAMKGDFSSEHLLQVYRKFIRRLRIKEAHVMGVGEGGALAISFGHHFPEHIKTAISINGFEGMSWSGQAQEILDRHYDTWQRKVSDLQAEAILLRKEAFIQDIKSLYVLAMIEYIDFPVMIVRSDRDDIVPEEYIDWSRSRIHKAEYRTLEGAGHYAFLDQPDRVAELIKDFILRTGD